MVDYFISVINILLVVNSQLEVFDVLVNEVSENVLDYLKLMTKLRDFGLHVITSDYLRSVVPCAFATPFLLLEEK